MGNLAIERSKMNHWENLTGEKNHTKPEVVFGDFTKLGEHAQSRRRRIPKADAVSLD